MSLLELLADLIYDADTQAAAGGSDGQKQDAEQLKSKRAAARTSATERVAAWRGAAPERDTAKLVYDMALAQQRREDERRKDADRSGDLSSHGHAIGRCAERGEATREARLFGSPTERAAWEDLVERHRASRTGLEIRRDRGGVPNPWGR